MQDKNYQESIIRKFYIEVWGKGNLEVAEEVFHEDYIRHDLRPGDAPAGPAGQKIIAQDFRKAFPDLTVHLDIISSNGEYAFGRWTMSGTHLGKWKNIQPTNKKVVFSGVNIFRFENDKVKELWNHRDDLGLMQQLSNP